MTEDITLRGSINLAKEPPVIRVEGSLIVYRDDDVVEISRIEADASEPSVLSLRLRVIEGSFPMKGVVRHWIYEEGGEHVRNYNRVSVQDLKSGTRTIAVRVLKSNYRPKQKG
ncbi:MAG: hypothetical protein HY913_14120 [Desulfomonile tiedjei]|nr:hypothetical protein [Desulfomonile tiedjei]